MLAECAAGETLTPKDTAGPLCTKTAQPPAPPPPSPDPGPEPEPEEGCCDPPGCHHSCYNGGKCDPGVKFPNPRRAWCDCSGTGYKGDSCEHSTFDCCDTPCFEQCWNGGKCLPEHERKTNEFCDCGTDYTGETCRTKRAGITVAWQIVCVVVTACGSLTLLCLVPHHRRTLRSLCPLNLPETDREQSYGGAVLFMVGIADLLLSVKTCYDIFDCEKQQDSLLLALCFLAALVVNYLATIGLSFDTLNTIRDARRQAHLAAPLRSSVATDSSTTRTALLYPKLIPFVILGSIPRMQSLAMLRLRLCGVEVFKYPMDDRHMFFLRNCGLHHVFVADVPVAVISLALIHSASGKVSPCQGDSLDRAKAMLLCKVILMIWGGISAITQLLLTGNCLWSLHGSHEGADGILEVETVASVMRSTAASLRTTEPNPRTTPVLRQDRTSQWVDGGGGGGGRSSDGAAAMAEAACRCREAFTMPRVVMNENAST